jgi:abortive infection bacteriophage resistance protein
MDFNKRPLTIEEQIALLKERGMIIPDEAKAKMLLSNVSYYRLSASLPKHYMGFTDKWEREELWKTN